METRVDRIRRILEKDWAAIKANPNRMKMVVRDPERPSSGRGRRHQDQANH